MEWFIQNKQWLFSGLAVSVPLAIIGWLLFKQRKRHIQKQRGGDFSTNIQVGDNLNVGRRELDKND